MRPAALYLRVSKPSQRILGVSPEAQEAKGRAWADIYGYDIGDRVFKDLGISGGKIKNRPELQKALTWACESRGTLIVYSHSRLIRSVHEAIHIEERMKKAGANLASVTELYDTGTASGWMTWMFLLTVDEGELRRTSERTISSLRYLKSNGYRYGPIPYGYSLDKAEAIPGTDKPRHKLIENPAEQAVIARIRQLAGQGLTPTQIAETLFTEHIRTRTGGELDASAVRRILNGRSPAVGHARRQE